MTEHYKNDAKRVVSGFKNALGDELAAQIGDEHFGELTMLIESAISGSVLQELEKAADKIASVADGLRKHAEHYD